MIRRILIAALVVAAVVISLVVDEPVSAEKESQEVVTSVLQSRQLGQSVRGRIVP